MNAAVFELRDLVASGPRVGSSPAATLALPPMPLQLLLAQPATTCLHLSNHSYFAASEEFSNNRTPTKSVVGWRGQVLCPPLPDPVSGGQSRLPQAAVRS